MYTHVLQSLDNKIQQRFADTNYHLIKSYRTFNFQANIFKLKCMFQHVNNAYHRFEAELTEEEITSCAPGTWGPVSISAVEDILIDKLYEVYQQKENINQHIFTNNITSHTFPIGNKLSIYKFSISDIKSEPMLYQASTDFAKKNLPQDGITARFLTCLKDNSVEAPQGYTIVLDTRSHMLMPGMYPAIPGWHCDNVPRDENKNICLDKVDPNIKHFLMCLAPQDADPMSYTEFLVTPFTAYLKDHSDNVWRDLHTQIEKEQRPTFNAINGQLFEFDQLSIHRATPAKQHGWRWFARASFVKLPFQHKNEIRQQSQVYLLSEENGW